MPSYATLPYRNATAIANHLMSRILRAEDDKAVSLLVREWRELEQMKREWRGIPRLSPADIRDLLASKERRAKQINRSTTEPTEVIDLDPTEVKTSPAEPDRPHTATPVAPHEGEGSL